MAFIARQKWPALFLIFLVGLVALGILFGALDAVSNGSPLWPSIYFYTSFFLGAEDLVSGLDRGAQWIDPIAGLSRTAAHAVVFGAVVFRLLIPEDLFARRSRFLVRRTASGQWEAVVRVYNATKTELLDISISAYLRTPVSRDARRPEALPDGERALVPFVENTKLALYPNKGHHWPLSVQPSPFSFLIPLYADDVCYCDDTRTLRRMQGHCVTPTLAGDVRGEAFLIVFVKAYVPDLASEHIETHWFRISGDAPDYEFGDFHDVMVPPSALPKKPSVAPRKWQGWSTFDDAWESAIPKGRIWVFGYGSLVHRENLEAFFRAHGLAPGYSTPTVLTGFRRVWNVATDNTVDAAGYKYFVDPQTGARPNVFVTFLNIARAAAGAEPMPGVEGVVFEVDEAGLAALDRRERNYCRIDVTDRFERVSGTVWTYIGKPEAEERFRLGMMKGTAVISADYKADVEAAFAAAGRPFDAEQHPDIAVVPLARIDT